MTPAKVTPEELARYFHAEYERMAEHFGWETQERSRKVWDEVPEENRRLMLAVATSVLLKFFPGSASLAFGPEQDTPKPGVPTMDLLE